MAALHNGITDTSILDALKTAGLEDMKTVTRQYARYQVRLMRRKLMSYLLEQPCAITRSEPDSPPHHPRFFVLDSTDPTRWQSSVADPAVAISSAFIQGDALPSPLETSDAARAVLTDAARAAADRAAETPCRRVCEICGVTCVTESAWALHIKGRSHKRAWKNRMRRSLVVVEGKEQVGEEGGREMSPDLGLLEGLQDI